MRIALKPASFTALIVRLVTTGLPHAVSALMLLSAMPISIVSPSCPGAEHSSWLPRFHPTTFLFHSCAVGCAFILILISMSSSVVKMFLKFMIIMFLLVDCKNTKKNANHQIFCHLSTNFFRRISTLRKVEHCCPTLTTFFSASFAFNVVVVIIFSFILLTLNFSRFPILGF